MLHEAGAKFTQHRMIHPGVSQCEAEQVLPVDATAHRMGRLTVREVLGKL
jgi:hypothetical protein